MAKRPTLADVARVAGVGPATVDRVINGRSFVRAETSQRVFEAAKAVGYHGTRLLRRRLDEATQLYRFGFLLQRPVQPFYQALDQAVQDACGQVSEARVTPEIRFLPSQNPADIVAGLHGLAKRAQAIAAVAIDHPLVTAAVAEIEAAGIPVFSLLSDFASGVRHGYVGLNNRKVGRTSGWLLSRCTRGPGKVAIFVGSYRFHGHEMREIGCRAYLREAAPELEIIDTQSSLEDVELAREAVLGLLQRHPDLRGIYVAGGGIEGVIAAPGQIAVVGNENTEVTRPALAENVISAVISTPRPALAREAVIQMLAALASPAAPGPGQTFLPFDIFVSENI